MAQLNLIQEVSFTGDVIAGTAKPEYKVDTYVNMCHVEYVRPTKREDVLALLISGKSSYVLRKDFNICMHNNGVKL